MLLTLVRDNGSATAPVPAGDGESFPGPASPAAGGGSRPRSFTIEVPYSPQGASVLAHVLLSWRLAKPGRSVYLLLPDEPEVEIGELSPSRIEWMLPVVVRIAIIERPGMAAAEPADED